MSMVDDRVSPQSTLNGIEPTLESETEEVSRTTNDRSDAEDAATTKQVRNAPTESPNKSGDQSASHLMRELESRIERFSINLRDHVTLMVADTQGRADRKHAKEIQQLLEEKMRALNDLSTKYQDELTKSNALERDLKRSHASGRASTDLLRVYKERLAVGRLKQRSFLMWKRQFDSHVRLLELERIWAVPRYTRRQTSRTFSAWRKLAHKRQKRAEFERWKAHVEQVSGDLIHMYEAKLAETRSELNLAQCELSELQESRAMAEQDMRRAFMRGVSALNLEAMSMFQRGDAENDAQRQNTTAAAGERASSSYGQRKA